MASRSEIMAALQGALALARGDQAGHRMFNHSMDGFWRSFGAIVLIAPVTVIATTAELAIKAELGGVASEDAVGFHLMRLGALAADWAAYPLVMVPLAQLFGLGGRYASYIIAYNWCSVVIVAVLVAPWAVYLTGLVPAELALLANLAALAWAVWFRFQLARNALGTNVATSAGLVMLEFLLSLTINSAGESLLA